MNRNTIAGAIVGAALAAGSTFMVTEAWDSFGWTPPEVHDRDVSHLEDDLHDATHAIKEFQAAWECDEDLESIEELAGKSSRTRSEVIELAQLSEKIDENDCHRFR